MGHGCCWPNWILLIAILMIINQGYWLLMVNIELSDKLKLIKHQVKIFQAQDDNVVFDQVLGSQVHSNQRTNNSSPRRQVTKTQNPKTYMKIFQF